MTSGFATPITQRLAAVAAAAGLALALAGPAGAVMYSDTQNSPYARSIEKLSVVGVIAGFPDGTFKPDQPITRLTVVEALARGLDVKGSGTIPNFKDLADIPEAVRPTIAALLNTGAASQQKATVTQDAVAYTLTTDRAVYGIDDPVDLTFTITNTGKDDVKFEFPTTQYYDFVIKRGDEQIARWSLGQTFVPNPQPLFLAGGRSMTFNTRWLQKDQDSHVVGPGTYNISAVFPLKDNPITVNLEFQKGILTAFPDNTFRPAAQVTRAEFSALLVRALGLQGEATQKAQAQLAVTDAADVPAPLHGYVAVAIDHKLLAVTNNVFRPNAPTTRAEAAAALAAIMDAQSRFNYVKGALASISQGDITVANDQKAVTSYALTPQVAIYRNDKPVPAAELKPNDKILLLLTGPRGRAGYIEATGP
ncbi:MAG TPA: S-layer homology domain-containing protein [bacterium]|nr:S-layer homology domain-containing protein [bacterium]